MTRRRLTHEEIIKAIRQLRKKGRKLSAQNVHAVTGGSMMTVHRLLTGYLNQEPKED